MSESGFDFDKEFDRLAKESQRESTTVLGGIAVRLVRVTDGGEGR